MNIYRCCYKGVSGFASKVHRTTWLFIPDPDQTDSRVRHNLSLTDLVFKNRHEFEYELGHPDAEPFSVRQFIRSRFFSSEPAHTTAGMLLLP